MRKIRKFLLWLSLFLITLFGVVSLFLYLNQDRLIQSIIQEANKQLDVPIEVNKIAINWYDDFPNISVICDDVKIQESIEGSKATLAELQQLAFSFDIISLISGKYTFDRVKLKNGEVTIRITPSGEKNYLIVKSSADGQPKEVNFKLNKIDIEKVTINYLDENLDQSHQLFAEQIKASLAKEKDIYQIDLNGNLTTKNLRIQELSYFKNKEVTLALNFSYNESNEQLKFAPSTLGVYGNQFEIKGGIELATTKLNLAIDGIDTDIQTIASLLPNEYYNTIKSYNATGNAKFHSVILGELSSRNSPLVKIDFNVTEAYMVEPVYKTIIDSLSFKGSFTNGSQHAMQSCILKIEDAQAFIKGAPIIANIQLSNFNTPHLSLSTEGSISTKDLFSFLPIKDEFSQLEGSLDFNIGLDGKIDHFKKASTAKYINNSGEIILTNVGGIYKPYPLPLTKISGRLLFNKNDIAINTLEGKIAASDIEMNGFFLNIIPYLLNNSESLLIEAFTKSNFIDLNELLSGLTNETHSQEKQQAAYRFSISPYIQLDLKSQIDELIFQRFKGSKIAGNIAVSNQVLTAKRLQANTMGGKIVLSGSINTLPKETIDIHTDAKLNQINIDSIFYTFHDFNQSFLTQRNLKGKIDADVLAHIVLDKSLIFKPADFEASILASVKDGKLIDFEPMQSLSDYVNEADLANLSFGELKNSIQIKNKTIYLPEMLIKSNVSEIQLQGTHTFSQAINYNLLVPLKNYKKSDKDEAFGAIEETDEYTKLFLKITGTTDDFKVSWDGKKTLNSVGGKLKEEAQNIKKLVTGKGLEKEKKKEIEVKEDDYFDW